MTKPPPQPIISGRRHRDTILSTLSTETGGTNDGVDVHIVVGGATNFNGASAFGSTVNSGTQNLVLASGTYVDFVVGPGTSDNDSNDSTRFNASISLVPEPSSALLMAAAVPLLPRRRRSAQK